MASFSLVEASGGRESDFSRTAWGKGIVSEAGELAFEEPRRPRGKIWVPAKGVCADLSASSSGHPGLPFPPLSAPGRAAGARDREGDPCRRRGRGAEADPPLPHRAPHAAVTHLSGPTGIGSAGQAGRRVPQERTCPRAVGSGVQSWRGPQTRCQAPRPIPPVPTRTFRPPTSAAAAPRPGLSVPPASPSRFGRRSLDLGPTAVVPSAEVWVSPPVLTHRPQCGGRLVGGASGRRGCWEV